MHSTDNLSEKARRLHEALAQDRRTHAQIFPKIIFKKPPYIFDFTKNNHDIQNLDVTDIGAFDQYVNNALSNANTTWGTGGYGENRVVYRSPLFASHGEARTVHLALDLWVPARTEIFAPLDGIVHSFQINDHLLDYGPTIILEHSLAGSTFYTLYGHCAKSSLQHAEEGKNIAAGEKVAVVGNSHENGKWPPHLHFQIIADLLGKRGDFPGVAKWSERDFYLTLCPDPNLLLRIPALMGVNKSKC